MEAVFLLVSAGHNIPFHYILNYIYHLKTGGLSISFVKVHHKLIDGSSVFTHPITRRFLKGLQNIYPPHNVPPPSWDLNLVLDCLMRSPFKPITTCPLLLIKVLFLTAIISARRVSETGALRVGPLYTIFTKDKVTLRPYPTFLPKISTAFHVNEPIALPTFFPSLMHPPGMRCSLPSTSAGLWPFI